MRKKPYKKYLEEKYLKGEISKSLKEGLEDVANGKATRIRLVDEWERERNKKQPLRRKIRYKFWYICYYSAIRIATALRKLADKIDRI